MNEGILFRNWPYVRNANDVEIYSKSLALTLVHSISVFLSHKITFPWQLFCFATSARNTYPTLGWHVNEILVKDSKCPSFEHSDGIYRIESIYYVYFEICFVNRYLLMAEIRINFRVCGLENRSVLPNALCEYIAYILYYVEALNAPYLHIYVSAVDVVVVLTQTHIHALHMHIHQNSNMIRIATLLTSLFIAFIQFILKLYSIM